MSGQIPLILEDGCKKVLPKGDHFLYATEKFRFTGDDCLIIPGDFRYSVKHELCLEGDSEICVDTNGELCLYG